mmetsp:Transcript_16601/g.46423  ORF Transcript_16601/g.46423 Transcript_16601/m.46423 type:complete len:272 (-) Transcript_16601:277-1092(-)
MPREHLRQVRHVPVTIEGTIGQAEIERVFVRTVVPDVHVHEGPSDVATLAGRRFKQTIALAGVFGATLGGRVAGVVPDEDSALAKELGRSDLPRQLRRRLDVVQIGVVRPGKADALLDGKDVLLDPKPSPERQAFDGVVAVQHRDHAGVVERSALDVLQRIPDIAVAGIGDVGGRDDVAVAVLDGQEDVLLVPCGGISSEAVGGVVLCDVAVFVHDFPRCAQRRSRQAEEEETGALQHQRQRGGGGGGWHGLHCDVLCVVMSVAICCCVGG